MDRISHNPNHPNVPGYEHDDAPIDPASIWRVKGSRAPGAVEVSRRDAVMDAMGISRQLMFATGVGMWGVFLVTNESDPNYSPSITGNRRQYGLELIRAYNEWGMRTPRSSTRVRAVLPLIADDVPALIDGAKEMIEHGIRAIWLPSSELPAGRSPAHSDLDPFWRLMTRTTSPSACTSAPTSR